MPLVAEMLQDTTLQTPRAFGSPNSVPGERWTADQEYVTSS
jgi:hypothetical protein